MANTLITTSYLANKGLDVLDNNLVFAKSCNKSYADDFGEKDFKIGATVNIRRPPRYIGTFGPNLNIEDTNQTYIPVSINYQFHIDAQFSTADMALEAVEGENSPIIPALEAVANRVDSDGLYFAYQNTGLSLGTPGVTPTGFKLFSDALATLIYEGAPRNKDPDTLLDPFSMSSMADALKGGFNPQAQISDFFRAGIVARKTAGSDWYSSGNVPTWTTGAGGGTPVLGGITPAAGGSFLLTSGWAQTGLMTTTGWTSSAAARAVVGDVIQVAGLYPVNPQNRAQYGRALKQFVVIPPAGYAPMTGPAAPGGPQFAPATLATGTFNPVTGVYSSSSGGALTLTVAECAITGGQFQNCIAGSGFTGTPAITVNGGVAGGTISPQGIVMLKDSFALAFVDLPLPRGVETAKRAMSKKIGMSIRVVEQYTVNNDALPTRFDVAYGYSSLYRQQAVRIAC